MKMVILGSRQKAYSKTRLAAEHVFRTVVTVIKAVISGKWRVASERQDRIVASSPMRGHEGEGSGFAVLRNVKYFTLQSLSVDSGDPTRIAASDVPLSPVACNLTPASRRMRPFDLPLSPVSCNLSPASSRLSPVTRFLLPVFLAVTCGLIPVACLRAQTGNATISGRVTDPKGAVVPHTIVEAIQEDTNVKTTTQTNDDGLYYFAALPPAGYRIVVSKDGFKQVIQAGVVLHVQDSVTLNFALELGSMAETVTVSAEGNNINTTDGQSVQ